MGIPKDAQKWETACRKVRAEMAEHVARFVTPIGPPEDLEHGVAWAAGTYVRFQGAPYLLTSEHVVRKAAGAQLAHLPGPTGHYALCGDAIQAAAWPTDVALIRLEAKPSGPTRGVLAPSRLGRSYSPAEGELLFSLGFPGSTARRDEPAKIGNTRSGGFGTLEAAAVPCLMQAAPDTPAPERADFDPDKHVALRCLPAAARAAGGAPDASGMSGSLLWDTKYVACTSSKRKWGAEKARVCGIIWTAGSQPGIVVATKIEHVRPVLLSFLREECAYLHWVDRGQPLQDAMEDWKYAEERIGDL